MAGQAAMGGEKGRRRPQGSGRAIPAESAAELAGADERRRGVVALQQRAKALESEVAERRRLEDALKERLGELAENDRRKDEFLGMLGHELRNPLAPIRMAVDIMRMSLDAETVMRCLEIIDRQSRNLIRLADDLLDVARIARGRMELSKERFDLRAAASRALDATRELMAQRRHDVSVTLPPLPVPVHADPPRLEQVLVNLLTNAARYTPPGGRVWLTVEAAADDVEVRVRDTGIGIAPDLLARVFAGFQRTEGGLGRAEGGLGIGLTIARRLVEMHGGRIEARSDGKDRGSEFIVRLPRLSDGLRPEGRRPRPQPPDCAL